MKPRTEKGFTILELMIVLTVIAILTSLYIHRAQGATNEARLIACEKSRALLEEMEQRFQLDHGRPSNSVQELMDAGYVSRAHCPQAGVFAWTVVDPDLPNAHRELVCSVHGLKHRIRKDIPDK